MLLCYHGTDAYRLRQAMSDAVASMRERHGALLHVSTVDCIDEGAADEIERHLKYPSFFGDIQMILATNAAGPVLADILEHYALSAMDDIILVAVQNTSLKSSEKKVLATLMREASTTTELVPMTGKALGHWAVEYCTLRKNILTPAGAEHLLQRIGPDAHRMSLELEKLCAYAQGEPISAEMVRLLVTARPERDEWELSNAVAAHDKRATVTALWRKVQEGTPEPMLVGALASGLRNLLLVKDLTSRRRSSAEIAKLTGLHPFVISKTLRGAAVVDAHRLKHAHIALTHLDRDAKDGRADTIDGLFSLLLSL